MVKVRVRVRVRVRVSVDYSVLFHNSCTIVVSWHC